MKAPRSRKAMTEFLSSHFRYDTMSSWNAATSYARKVKIHSLTFPSNEVRDRAYDLVSTDEAYEDVRYVLQEFAAAHHYEWSISFNGRSSGYLVLYHSERKPSDYKSWCSSCGQGNCQEATDANKKCGRCGNNTRYNQIRYSTSTFPGRGVDQGEDFSEWDLDRLRCRVKLVREFDRACDDAVKAFIEFCKTHRAVEQTIHVPKRVLVAEEV